jgi:hypothetical protein
MRSLILALPLLAIGVAPAAAQVACGPRDEVAKLLNGTHAEVPVGQGLTASGMLLEIYASESGSWTVLATRPTNESCILATGEVWSFLDENRPDVEKKWPSSVPVAE